MVIAEQRPAETTASHSSKVEVILYSPRRCALVNELEAALSDKGWQATYVGDASALPQRVGPRHKAVVVICAPDGSLAMDVLSRLEEKRSSILTVVVSDEVEHGDYFCLMQTGAVAYFELANDRRGIMQGVEWAARVLAP